jgi:enoyl-CoA hydratase
MGLANRLVDKGAARAEAIALAHQLVALPQRCLRSDRRSMYESWSLSLEEALRNETRLGMATLMGGEMSDNVQRFTRGGEGRHGT